MSASDSHEQAEDHFKDENYEAAAAHYDRAVELAPTNARYLANRAQNSLKLKRYESALADATAALAIEPQNARAQFRQGIALFYLDRFEEAEKSLKAAAAGGQAKTEIWLRKCEAELARLDAPPVVVSAAPTAQPIVHKIDALPPAEKPVEKIEKAAEKPAVVAPKVPANLAERVREQWFQDSSAVTITLLAKGLKPEQVSITCDESATTVTATIDFPSDSSKFSRTWNLWGQIEGQPQMNLTAYKVELLLTKKDASTTWDSLERQADAPVAPVVKRENVARPDINYAAYPTSSKTIKNWAEVEEAAQKAEEEEKPEGEAALQKLFQSIYGGADEDTRRAMIKSFQTSGGTVLSTNWKEVAEKDYEKDRSAPAGQEMKDWNSRDRGSA